MRIRVGGLLLSLFLGWTSPLWAGSIFGGDIAADLSCVACVSLTTEVSGILPTANGGTGIAYFTAAGPTVARVYTFPDAAATILYSGGALGTPSSGTGTNITGIPAANILAGSFGAGAYVVSTSLQAATIELGHATDTTLSRVSAGLIAVEGVTVADVSTAQTFTNKTLTSPIMTAPALGTPASGVMTNVTGIPAASILAGSFGAGAYVISTSLQANTIELGHATDTTLARVSAGVVSIEGATIATLSAANTFTAAQTIPAIIMTKGATVNFVGATGATQYGLITGALMPASVGTTETNAFFTQIGLTSGAYTDVYNMHIINPGIGTATIATLYGLRIGTLNQATTNWGLYIDTNNSYFGGNVGIGTTNPQAKLNVRDQTGIIVDNTDTDYASVGSYAQLSLGASSGNTYSRLQVFNSGGAAGGILALNSLGGNVGIGTTGPNTLLHVLGADNSTVGTFEIAATSANVTAADTFVDFRSSGGSIGTIAGTAVSGTIIYNTFTGSHYTQVEEADRAALKIGMLLEATGDPLIPFTKQTRTRHVEEKRSKDDKGNDVVTPAQDIEENFQASTPSHLVRSRISRTKGSKAAYGVWGGIDKEGRDQVLALGTGMCIVARKAVNIEVGDYLMASDVPGSMEAQPGIVYQNSTVAKALSNVVWHVGEQSRTIPCIYLGG